MEDQEAETASSPEPRRCGRPTRSGKPCANLLRGRIQVACGTHATDADRAVGAAYWKGWREGEASGKESGRWAVLEEQANERRRQEYEAAERARFRERDKRGQLVIVDNGKPLVYRWTGLDDLAIGDLVVVPPNWLIQHSRTCPVTALGSSYELDIQNILRRAPVGI